MQFDGKIVAKLEHLIWETERRQVSCGTAGTPSTPQSSILQGKLQATTITTEKKESIPSPDSRVIFFQGWDFQTEYPTDQTKSHAVPYWGDAGRWRNWLLNFQRRKAFPPRLYIIGIFTKWTVMGKQGGVINIKQWKKITNVHYSIQ